MDLSPIDQTLRDRSDEEILSWSSTVGGPAVLLEHAFVGLCDAFLSERAAGRNAVIQWDVKLPGSLVSYQLEVEKGACSAAAGVTKTPTLVLAMGLPTLLRLLTGGLDGRSAYQQGLVRAEGDMDLAKELDGWFRPPG